MSGVDVKEVIRQEAEELHLEDCEYTAPKCLLTDAPSTSKTSSKKKKTHRKTKALKNKKKVARK